MPPSSSAYVLHPSTAPPIQYGYVTFTELSIYLMRRGEASRDRLFPLTKSHESLTARAWASGPQTSSLIPPHATRESYSGTFSVYRYLPATFHTSGCRRPYPARSHVIDGWCSKLWSIEVEAFPHVGCGVYLPRLSTIPFESHSTKIR